MCLTWLNFELVWFLFIKICWYMLIDVFKCIFFLIYWCYLYFQHRRQQSCRPCTKKMQITKGGLTAEPRNAVHVVRGHLTSFCIRFWKLPLVQLVLGIPFLYRKVFREPLPQKPEVIVNGFVESGSGVTSTLMSMTYLTALIFSDIFDLRSKLLHPVVI